MEDLKILTQNDLEHEKYEPRLKAQGDRLSMMGDARREGLAEGLAKDSMLGTIQTL